MDKMKISLITTVLNEEKNIIDFIKSLSNQITLPEEVIVVDGGSKDETVLIIKKLIKKYKRLNIKLIIKTGNRSVGRNTAIKNTKHELIAVTDAGCILDKNWIKNIKKPFESSDVDIVSGFYKPTYKNIFQKCLSTYTSTMSNKIDKENFFPSSRSVAFRKSAWERVKGYPENLDTCEDLVFDKKLKENDFKFYFQKSAFVYWPQRKNIFLAFFQFFNYARGDGFARYFRSNTPFLFLRYFFAVYLIILSVIMKSMILNIFILFCLICYTSWSIFKNYRYVNNRKALIYLPMLQFASDFAVLLGTSIGFILGTNLKNVLKNILNFKGVLFVIVFYVLILLSVIAWGIPGLGHPFNYFMDEWHQSQSVRDLFKLGTPNVPGAANGSIFQFFLSGIYLIPFYIFHIINPFAIKSSVTNLQIQGILFQVLRINTLLFGVGSIVSMAYIAKKYFKLNTFLVSFLFAFNPLFMTLSNYFKYDIALLFWIILSFIFLLRYSEKPSIQNFVLGGFFIGLSLSTKLLTPLPLVGAYIISFFLFTASFKNNLKILFYGLLVCTLTYLLFGNPDLLLGRGSLNDYLYSNMVLAPLLTANYNLGLHWWIYLVLKLYPVLFGRILYSFFILGIIWGSIFLVQNCLTHLNKSKKILINIFNNNKFNTILILCGILFYASLIPIKIQASNNRVLVLLPFIVLTSALLINKLHILFENKRLKGFFVVLIVALLIFQFLETTLWVSIKWSIDPRSASSNWILKNIPVKSTVGIENIPIYQFLPDIVEKEFYFIRYNIKARYNYNYKVISSKDDKFPKFIIITNDDIESQYLKKSPKKDLVIKLKSLGYKKIIVFNPNFKYFKLLNSELEYYISGIVQSPNTISIYEKL